MKELLTTFSIEQILLYAVFLFVAIKNTVDAFDWVRDRFNKVMSNKNSDKTKNNRLINRVRDLEDKQIKQEEKIEEINRKIDMLIESDMYSIKNYITEKHAYYTELGYIDYYQLSILESRYEIYKQEHGNSFVHELMKDLRMLEVKKESVDYGDSVENLSADNGI